MNIKRILLAFLCLGIAVGSVVARAESYVTYYHNDLLGSPVAATDEDGRLLWRENYKPYGEKITNNDRGNSVGYTGHQFDKSTGLVYMQARYYDPVVGRFMGMDPVGFVESNPMSFNRYTYANSNPYRYVDPDGRAPKDGNKGEALGELILFLTGSNVQREVYQKRLDRAVREIEGGGKGKSNAKKDAAKSAADRATEIHKAVPEATQRRTTIAVTETAEGISVVSSSEKRLRPAQRKLLRDGEVEGVGPGHAEVTGVNASRGMGLNPTGTAASRAICDGCQGFLKDQGVKPLSKLK